MNLINHGIGRAVFGACLGLAMAACRGGGSDGDGGGDGDETGGSASDSADDGDDGGQVEHDPGRVTLRRLNRAEYNNTVRDLFYGLDLRPGDDFPADDAAHGFDNIADVLSMTPVLFELYERAADQLLDAALFDPKHDAIRQQVVFCDVEGSQGDADACAWDIIARFAQRAWRRPMSDDEIDALFAHVGSATAQGSTRTEGVALALKHALVSVHFLFRVELDPDPSSAQPHLLGDYELASRLSYLLWSSMPDDDLFAAAAAGELQDPAQIEAQVIRMAEDPRTLALLYNFAGQWLYLRALPNLSKDAAAFPDFDEPLRAAAELEALLNVDAVLTGQRRTTDLLDGDTTFVNDRLARHYGLPEPGSSDLVEVSVADAPRRGLLTQAALMGVLSHPDRTSPSRRGKWVLEQLLCAPPPPPPPDVDDTLPPLDGAQTVREQLEQHRSDPACASCHVAIDAIGLSFENYDATGAYRTQEGGQPIDASGTLPDGASFDDALELVELLAQRDDFARCVAKQLMTYALGRAVDEDDTPHIDEAIERFSSRDHRFPELLLAVTLSDAFRARRGEP